MQAARVVGWRAHRRRAAARSLRLPRASPLPDAIKVYLSNRETANLAPASLRKYGVVTQKLQAFADSRGYTMLDQFTARTSTFSTARASSASARKGRCSKTSGAFFRFFVNREFIAKSPVSADLKPPIGGIRMANKMPFSDEQLADIIKACDQNSTDTRKMAAGATVTARVNGPAKISRTSSG